MLFFVGFVLTDEMLGFDRFETAAVLGKTDLRMIVVENPLYPFDQLVLFPFGYTQLLLLGIFASPIHVLGGSAVQFEQPFVPFATSAQAFEYFAAHFGAFAGIGGLTVVFVELTVVLVDGSG
jgi:hypothetical protein